MAMPRRQVGLDQFLELPEEEPALEFEGGRITQKVSPKGKHSRVQAKLSDFINRLGEPRKLALALPELRTTFAGCSCVPDVAVYRWERVPVDEAGRIANDFFEPPDIAIEIASPDQSVNALVRRCLWYVANGVSLALLVDPLDESVLVFRPSQVPRVLRGSDGIDVSDLLPGFELTVQELFDSLNIR